MSFEVEERSEPSMMFWRPLRAASGRLGHLVVLAAFGIVKLLVRLAVVMRQKAAAEAQGFELHDGGQCERMQPPKATVFVEELLSHRED